MKIAVVVVALAVLVLLLPASGKTAVLGPYKLSFVAPADLSQSGYDTPLALEDETLYSYAAGNSDVTRECVFRLHDRLKPCDFEQINDTFLYWLGVGTVRVKSWNASTNDTIIFKGEGITSEKALQAYGYAKAFKVTNDHTRASMFIVLKTVGLTKAEAERLFASTTVT
jgi:hypothetical protein